MNVVKTVSNKIIMSTVTITDLSTLFKVCPIALKYMEQTEEICWTALKANPDACSEFIKDITEEMSLYVISKTWDLSENVYAKQTDEIKWALARHWYTANFSNIIDPTEEMCLEAIRKSPETIRYIKNPTEEMCMLAIKGSPHTLYCIANQTEEMCVLAVSLDGSALCCVKNQTDEMCQIAINNPVFTRKDITLLACIREENQTLEICLELVKRDPRSIKYVCNLEIKRECCRHLGIQMKK